MGTENKFIVTEGHSPKGGLGGSFNAQTPNFIISGTGTGSGYLPRREDPSQPTRQRRSSANKTAKPTIAKPRIGTITGKSVPPGSNQSRPTTNQRQTRDWK